MNIKPLYLALFSTLIPISGAAWELNKDPNQTSVDMKPVVNSDKIEKELLRNNQIGHDNISQESDKVVVQYTGRELVENPDILEDLLVKALISKNVGILPGYIKLYALVPNADTSLID
ncbi:hypothetical protein HT655_09745, partial [Ursidibacter maritimus]